MHKYIAESKEFSPKQILSYLELFECIKYQYLGTYWYFETSKKVGDLVFNFIMEIEI